MVKSGNFKHTGKVGGGNHTKYWKTQGISEKCDSLFFNDNKMNCVLFAKMENIFS